MTIETMETLHGQLEERTSRQMLEDEIARLRDIRERGGSLASLGKGEVHRLWSEGHDPSTYENTHRCWDYYGTVG